MERLIKRLASDIAFSLGYDDEKESVLIYGLTAIMQISLTVILVILFGILTGVPVEVLIVCFSASILRNYSGGVHAVTAGLCTSISVIYCTLTALLSRKLLFALYNPVPMIIAIVIIFGISYFIIYKYAPVDSPNKPIKTEKKIKRMRKGSFIIISVYFLLSVIMFVAGYKYDVINSYGICLLFGVAWQIFTLTDHGANFMDKLNNLYISLRKEVHK